VVECENGSQETLRQPAEPMFALGVGLLIIEALLLREA